jgi:hypothetical protein
MADPSAAPGRLFCVSSAPANRRCRISRRPNPCVLTPAKLPEERSPRAAQEQLIAQGLLDPPGLARTPHGLSAAKERGRLIRARARLVNNRALITSSRTRWLKICATRLRNVRSCHRGGPPTRVDLMAGNPVTGTIHCFECKSSESAPLTKDQRKAFPRIEQGGATILGAGKPAFPGGSSIPPTKIEFLVRPKE